MEKLSATISNLSEQLRRNANEARAVSDEVNRAAERVAESNERMCMLIHSMADIKSTSHEIDKIIKIIEDIAFQTNILALNAAVEASRAGDAGKGFAFVAEEVRNLASKSAEAAQGSAELIRASVNAVAVGSTLADETAERLASTVSDIKSINSAVTGISEASERQADNISHVSESIKQISDVVQNNSATSEQTAASSQELSAQAQMLNALVERFQIKGTQPKTTAQTESRPKS